MSDHCEYWVGADPGGKDKFAVACLRSDGLIRTDCVDCADDAVAIVKNWCPIIPAGVGVDVPLWWSSGPTGIRKADKWLREKYGFPSRNVQDVNSMWGSVLIQGVMFVHRMRESYGVSAVTESHPKALWRAQKIKNWNDLLSRYCIPSSLIEPSEDERDAVIAAICAREGFEGRWTHDLSLNRHSSEMDPKSHWLSPVSYFWPET